MPRVDLMERLGKFKFSGYVLGVLAGSPHTRGSGDDGLQSPLRLYHFTVMPFGLHWANTIFQRLMDQVPRGSEDYAAAYIDDVAVYSMQGACSPPKGHLSIASPRLV